MKGSAACFHGESETIISVKSAGKEAKANIAICEFVDPFVISCLTCISPTKLITMIILKRCVNSKSLQVDHDIGKN